MKPLTTKQLTYLSWTAAFLSFLFLFCLLLLPVSSFLLTKVRDVQFPPGDIGNVVRDNEGNYYYTDVAYQRVQTFDKQGIFKNSWHVNAQGGYFVAEINADNQLRIIARRSKKEFIFDRNGHFVASSDNANYNFDNKNLSKSLKGIRIPFYLWIFNPFIALSYIIVALLLNWFVKRNK